MLRARQRAGDPRPSARADAGRASGPLPESDPGGSRRRHRRGGGGRRAGGVRARAGGPCGGRQPHGLTFLRRLHGAAGGRRGPQSFSSPAAGSRRAEWKLGRDWKTGAWHPRGRGGAEQEEERAPPGSGSREADSPADARCLGSASRAPEKCHPGACGGAAAARDPSGVAVAGLGGVRPCPVPTLGSRIPRSDCACESGVSKSRSDAGPGSASCLFKAGKHLPRLPPPGAPSPPPCHDITPRPPEPARARGTSAERGAPPRTGLPLFRLWTQVRRAGARVGRGGGGGLCTDQPWPGPAGAEGVAPCPGAGRRGSRAEGRQSAAC